MSPQRARPGRSTDRRGGRSGARGVHGERGQTSRTVRWRVAARLARRQVRRTWVSSALIVTLIVLPITAMAAVAVYVNSMIATPEERVTAQLGQMQGWVQPYGVPDAGMWQVPDDPNYIGYPNDEAGSVEQPPGEVPADPLAALPPGTETVKLSSGQTRITTVGGVAAVMAWGGPVWDPRFEGRFSLIDGRAPTSADEVLVTPATLERIDSSIGGTLASADGDDTYRITGTFRAAWVGAGDAAVAFFDADRFASAENTKWYLPELSLTWEDVQELNAQGVVAYARDVVLDPPPFTFPDGWEYVDANTQRMNNMLAMAAALAAGGVAAGYMVVMLAGAAFAVSARRQQRALAIAASVGADARDLRRTVVLQGTVLGLVAGAIGTVLGVGIGLLVVHLSDDGSRTLFWGLHVPWEMLIGIAVFAAIVGTVSALVPARGVARTDTISALRGARRPVSVTAARPLWGSLLVLIGVGVTIVCGVAAAAIAVNEQIAWDSPLRWMPVVGIIGGPILAQLGILLSGRWLLWLASLVLARVGIAARMASRDALANGARTVPAFAAIAATVFVGVFAVGLGTMTVAQGARAYAYAAPVGTAQVYFYESGPELLTAEQAAAAAEAAVSVLGQIGVDDSAVVSRQVTKWEYETVSDIDPALTRAVAVTPEKALIDPNTRGWSGGAELTDPQNNLSIVPAEGIEAATGIRLTEAQLTAYRAGSALVLDSDLVVDGEIDVSAWTEREWMFGGAPSNIFRAQAGEKPVADPQWTRSLPAIVAAQPEQTMAVILAPETAADLGMTVQPRMVFGTFASEPTTEQRDRLYALTEAESSDTYTLSGWIETGPPSALTWLVPLLAAVAVLVLGASGVALGLARFERRPDDATLSAVGGTTALRRRIGFWQGLLIAGFGTAAGAAAGILPPIGFWLQSQTSWQGAMDLADIPWVTLAVFAVALPLAIATVNWLVPPRRPDLTRRTAIA